MGELAEAIRRANQEGTEREDRAQSAAKESPATGRTLSLEEVLGHTRRSVAETATEQTLGAARPSSRASGPNDPTLDAARRHQPIVQTVAREAGTARAERISIVDAGTPGAAAARRLAQKVKRSAALRDVRSIVITSSLRGEGKTTTACNLAIALTRLDRSESVVLVDLDLRRPSVARSLGLTPVRTVEDVLARRVPLEDALLGTDIPGLSVLAMDRGTSSPEGLLSSQNLRHLIEQLERRFSRVVIDTPPAIVVADASEIIEAADAYIFVARAGSTPTRSIQSALDHLPREKVLGCVLNHAREARSTPADYYSYDEDEAALKGGEHLQAKAEEAQ